MSWGLSAAFMIAVLPLVLTPGASFMLTTRHVLAAGPRAGCGVVAGTAVGIYIHASSAALGLSALVMASAVAFEVLRLAGAAYLVILGLLLFWRTGRPRVGAPRPRVGRGRGAFTQAVWANVLNPKAASIYLTLLPQFLAGDVVGLGPALVLATAHVVVMAAWLGLCVAVLVRGRALTTTAFRRWCDRAGGVVLVLLGLRSVAVR